MVVDIGEVKRYINPKADSTLRNMRKDDLIEYIRCLENNYNVAVSFNNQQAKNIELLIPKWIPVSERLPEEGKWVLCLKNGRWHWLAIWNPKEWTDGEFWEEETVVTHWMPLPEPPKEWNDG